MFYLSTLGLLTQISCDNPLFQSRAEVVQPFVGSYTNEDYSWKTLTITSMGISLGTSNLLYDGDGRVTSHSSVSVQDANNITIKAVYGEWSEWSGYKDCSGGLSRDGDSIIISFSGGTFCEKFSGRCQKEGKVNDFSLPNSLKGEWTCVSKTSKKKSGKGCCSLLFSKKNIVLDDCNRLSGGTYAINAIEDDEPIYRITTKADYGKVDFVIQYDGEKDSVLKIIAPPGLAMEYHQGSTKKPDTTPQKSKTEKSSPSKDMR